MSDVRLSILSATCGACPFKGEFGNGVRGAGLYPRRLKEILRETTEGDGAYFVCHKTVDYTDENNEDEDGAGDGSDAVFGPAKVCSGWLDAVTKMDRVPAVVQIAERLDFIEWCDPPLAEADDVG